MIRLASPLGLLAATAGLIIWAAGFSTLYGISALGCEYGWAARELLGINLFRLTLGLIWALHLATLAFLLRWSAMKTARDPERFLHFVAVTLSAAGFLAMIWTGLPVLITSACL